MPYATPLAAADDLVQSANFCNHVSQLLFILTESSLLEGKMALTRIVSRCEGLNALHLASFALQDCHVLLCESCRPCFSRAWHVIVCIGDLSSPADLLLAHLQRSSSSQSCGNLDVSKPFTPWAMQELSPKSFGIIYVSGDVSMARSSADGFAVISEYGLIQYNGLLQFSL